MDSMKRRTLSPWLALRNAIADRLVFAKVREKLGGRFRLGISGGAPLPAEIGRFFHALGILIVEGYGLTECTSAATVNRPERFRFGTVGPALPGVELRIADDGEILIRTVTNFAGYYKDEAATREILDDEGWLHSGDIGHLDEAGNLKITDRLKDMFIVGGFNVSPAEVEQVLARHPLVSEVAVVGVPDERLGEVGKAFVVARPGAGVEPDEVVAFCRERMANYKVPRSVEVVDTLPRNASGKVLKFALRDSGS